MLTVMVEVVCDRLPLVPVMLNVNDVAVKVEGTEMVRFEVFVLPAVVIATGLGTKPSVTPVGRVDVESVMLPVNAPRLVKLTVKLPEEPALMLAIVGVTEMVKSLTTRLVVPKLVRWAASPL